MISKDDKTALMLEWMSGNRRAQCPNPGCRSGSGRNDPSVGMWVLDDGAVMARCFRNCGLIGVISGRARAASEQFYHTSPYCFEEPLVTEIPTTVKSSHIWHFGLTDGDLARQQVKWAPESKRIHFPIFNSKGHVIGGHLHNTDNSSKKRETYRINTEEPLLHFPKGMTAGGHSSAIILCEDMISAIRVSQFTPAAACLQAQVTQGHVDALLQAGWSHITICFDGDQAGRIGALRFLRRWGPCFQNANILQLPSGLDPKDLPDEQLIAWQYRQRL